MIKKLTQQDYLKMPWKNKLGFTLQLACSHTHLDDFDWRLSIADVTQDGSFSRFPDKNRIISVLNGEGIILKNKNTQHDETLYLYDVFRFSGADEIYAELVDGPIRDFNLIYNSVRYQAELWVSTQPVFENTFSHRTLIFIFNPNQTPVTVMVNNQAFDLDHFQSLLIQEQRNAQVKINATEQSKYYVITLRPTHE